MPTLKGIGISGQKVEYIHQIAVLVYDKPDFFNNRTHQPDGEIMKQLTALCGIGAWSAKMYLIFALNRLDVLPYEDGAFLQAYRWIYGYRRCDVNVYFAAM